MVTVTGCLKGYDALMNLVLDEGEESMHGTLLLFTIETEIYFLHIMLTIKL